MSRKSSIAWTVALVVSIPGTLIAAYCCVYAVWLTAYYTTDPQLAHAQRSAYFWFALMLIFLITPIAAVFRWLHRVIRDRKFAR